MRKADNLPPSCAVVTKSGNLNFLELSGPVQACNGTALPSIDSLSKNVAKYDRARQVTDDDVIGRMRFACRITKTKRQTRAQNVYFLFFQRNNGCTHAPQCYVTPTCLSCFFKSLLHSPIVKSHGSSLFSL